ncbi:MAG: ABC transporter substrate-binding protein [Chloroflexi bacterium]|nr:ABC transporter substrate-binding protein [Chloroflexota bacterium]MCL5074989.1 ABC transporter substrate-binding protein [Chloroflexota bacterium]
MKKIGQVLGMSLVFLLIGVLLSACVEKAAAPTPTPTAAKPAAEATKPAAAPSPTPVVVKEIKVGVLAPLTGPQGPAGLEMKNGSELLAEIVNGKYDLNMPLAKTEGLPNLGGAKVKLVFADDGGSPEKGKAEVERLITSEKVVAIVGTYASSVTAVASRAAESLGVPLLTPISTSPMLTQQGLKWFFRTTPHDQTFAQNFFQFLEDLKKKKGIAVKKIALIHENTLFGTDSAKFEAQYAKEYGNDVVTTIPYPANTASLSSEVEKLKGSGADIAMPTSYISDAILMVRTFKQLDYNPLAVIAQDAGFIESDFLKTVGKDGNYILSREVFALDLAGKKPLVKAVNDLYKQRYGANMTGVSSRNFTGTLTMLDAINRAGSTSPEAIRKALLETNIPGDQLIMPWDGVKFDPNTGQNILGRGIVVQAQGEVYYTVWPFELAAKDVIWPIPKWSERK